MSRSYYSAKALLVALAVGLTLCRNHGTGISPSRIARMNYGATLSAESMLTRSSLSVTRLLGGLAHHRDCVKMELW